ncbi:MAG: xanthine dehydrogenase family protein molybdopterin-binding subunit [Bacteroidetes bacterium]|nr:xanthine dehydrogenase family protein molybdopterin-binding subunit [Bacteroidota bacterium]
MKTTTDKSRREFLKSMAILGSGLVIPFHIVKGMGRGAAAAGVAAAAGNGPSFFAPNAFLTIMPDNTIQITLAHVEMGQGVWTTLPMLIAEELDCDWKDISVQHCPPDPAYNHTVMPLIITGGSTTTWSEFDRYRKAGATARVMLTEAGAHKMGVPVSSCRTENGYVISGDKRVSYGEVAIDAALLTPPKDVPLRKAGEWKYIGKGVKRLDTPEKVNGMAKFGMDVQYPGMLTAVVAHSPVMGGRPVSFDASKALRIAGVRKVVKIPSGVAVIAEHFWAAKKGRDVLKVTWTDGKGASFGSVDQAKRYREMASTDGDEAAKKGDVVAAMGRATKVVEGEFLFPYLAHAPMEPMNCTVKVTGGSCEIWTGTQMPAVDQANAAEILGISKENVKVNTMFLGGAFGRRATPESDFVSEAVEIAKASKEFIKLVWTREDDMKAGYYRPFFIHKVKVGLGADGMPTAWHHNIAGQAIMDREKKLFPLSGKIDGSSVEGVNDSPYLDSVPDHFVGLHSPKEVVPVLWYRSVGNTHTAYAMEVMIDAVAHAAGKDPIEYRRVLLKNHSRHLAALNLAAEKAGWGKGLAEGHFQGIAVHEAFGSFVAQVVEVSIRNGKPVVHKVTCAIDCGLAVNPDGVVSQMEGGIVWGLTMALYSEILLDKGQVMHNNFYDYKVLRMFETPVIDVHIVPSTEKMGGAGEPCVPPTAPALANAIFAATGKRIFELPIMKHFEV